MAISAVVFDYGMVLSGPPAEHAREKLNHITGLAHHDLERLYWVDRHAYDRGDLTGLAFWEKLASDAKLELKPEQINQLNHWDARMWTTANPATLAWHDSLRAHKIKTAILSNMGDSVLASIEESFPWVDNFDVLIWSYQYNMAKPEPEIYRLLLDRLGTVPEETLFLDDKLENIEAARAFGIVGLQFSSVPQLRRDLISVGLDRWLPLPEDTN